MAVARRMVDTEVKDLIRRTTDSKSERERTLTLHGADALRVVNGLQRWLDSTAGQTALAAERRRAIRLLVDLAKRSGEVPDGHYIKDVQYNPRAPSYYAGFSDVHEAEWSNLLVVMKRLRVNEGGDKSDIHKRICFEALTWRQFDHPNIVKFLGVFSEKISDNRERLALVSVRMKESLRSFIQSNAYNPRFDRKRLLIQIASALVYLHDQGIAHGDITLTNVLVDSSGQAFLVDFGLLAVGDGSTGSLSVPMGGSPQYLAPELSPVPAEDVQNNEWLVGDATGTSDRQPLKTKEGDVFAYGRLIVAIAVKNDPFGKAPNDFRAWARVKLVSPSKKPPASECYGAPMSDSLWKLASECWMIEPTMRPTMKYIVGQLSAPGFDA